MLLSADIKSLEIVVAAYLSNDKVLKQEVINNVDFHELNRVEFKLPERVVAKRLGFKILYGGTSFGFSQDAEFMHISSSPDYWQKKIDAYYEKYVGIRDWHKSLIQTALKEGKIVSPSGRVYLYPSSDVAKRLWFWQPKIKNYVVQGLGADLVMLARISLWNRLKGLEGVLPISSVHDSIVLDIKLDKDPKMCHTIGVLVRKVVQDVPANFERCFGQQFSLPLDAEVKVGPNLGHMEKLIEC